MTNRRLLPNVPWEQLPSDFKEILQKLGHTKGTYEKVRQAENLLHSANQSMRRRQGNVKFNIGYVTGPFRVIYRPRGNR